MTKLDYSRHILAIIDRLATAGKPTDAEILRVCDDRDTTHQQLEIAVEIYEKTAPLPAWRAMVKNLRTLGLQAAGVEDRPDVALCASVAHLLELWREKRN